MVGTTSCNVLHCLFHRSSRLTSLVLALSNLVCKENTEQCHITVTDLQSRFISFFHQLLQVIKCQFRKFVMHYAIQTTGSTKIISVDNSTPGLRCLWPLRSIIFNFHTYIHTCNHLSSSMKTCWNIKFKMTLCISTKIKWRTYVLMCPSLEPEWWADFIRVRYLRVYPS
jgi:hypothetical protein